MSGKWSQNKKKIKKTKYRCKYGVTSYKYGVKTKHSKSQNYGIKTKIESHTYNRLLNKKKVVKNVWKIPVTFFCRRHFLDNISKCYGFYALNTQCFVHFKCLHLGGKSNTILYHKTPSEKL